MSPITRCWSRESASASCESSSSEALHGGRDLAERRLSVRALGSPRAETAGGSVGAGECTLAEPSRRAGHSGFLLASERTPDRWEQRNQEQLSGCHRGLPVELGEFDPVLGGGTLRQTVVTRRGPQGGKGARPSPHQGSSQSEAKIGFTRPCLGFASRDSHSEFCPRCTLRHHQNVIRCSAPDGPAGARRGRHGAPLWL